MQRHRRNRQQNINLRGVFETICDGKLSAAKITFGAELKDGEIFNFILKHYNTLQFSPSVKAVVNEKRRTPKRMRRDAKKQVSSAQIGTKSQQALKLQQEQFKLNRKDKNSKEKNAEIKRKFKLRQKKKKAKHRGR